MMGLRCLAPVAAASLLIMQAGLHAGEPVYPGSEWPTCTPQQVNLTPDKLKAIADLVGGCGCVVRHGNLVYTWGDFRRSRDIASAVKPVISSLLLLAIQEDKIKSVDDKVADFEPRLRTLNDGKDANITWRHLASQTSGYGLSEAPGAAYAYNDFALALYYDVLMEKVFHQDGTAVLKEKLGKDLGFQDPYSFTRGRPGRLGISVRDFARFGLLYMRDGKWKDRQILKPEMIRLALNSPVPINLPRTSRQDADMIPGQRSLGGGKDQAPVGPGCYSFNWWLNRIDARGRRFFIDAPEDTYLAAGHNGKRDLWIIPSLDLIVVWNDANIDDHNASPGNAKTKCNQAAKLMRQAVVK